MELLLWVAVVKSIIIISKHYQTSCNCSLFMLLLRHENYQIGSCHCHSVKFEIESNLEKIVQCNCSICIRRNAKMIMIPKENFKLLEGSKDLSLYQFNTDIAKHFFCKKCGIYTHHNRKSDPNGMGVNLGCIEDIDPMEFKAIKFDGKKL